MDSTPAEQPVHATDRIVVTFNKFTRDSLSAQVEAFCKMEGLRYRIQEERGASASLYVVHLRGDGVAIARIKEKVLQLCATELLLIPPRRQLPRAAISAISFLVGLVFVASLFYLAT
jgi:hypothetical protein